MSNLYKLYVPLGSEFSCPDMEMIPLKTTENRSYQLTCLIEPYLGISMDLGLASLLGALAQCGHGIAGSSALRFLLALTRASSIFLSAIEHGALENAIVIWAGDADQLIPGRFRRVSLQHLL